MGVDACILVKAKTGAQPHLPWQAQMLEAVDAEATHEISNPWRYYGPGYERGPWPEISAVLLELLADPDIEAVWYFGDCGEAGQPLTLKDLHAINRHYVKFRHEPFDAAAR